MLVAVAFEGGCTDPVAVADRIRLLYDGAVTGAQLDADTAAVRVARRLAAETLQSATRQ